MKKRNSDIDNYFNYRHYTYVASSYYMQINDYDIIDEIIQTNFNPSEQYIFEEYLIKKRSLKSIALDLNYSYSYTRQILFRSREKLNILLTKRTQ